MTPRPCSLSTSCAVSRPSTKPTPTQTIIDSSNEFIEDADANFDFTVDAQRINLNYQNLTAARVPLSKGGCGSYSRASCTLRAASSPA